MKRSGKHTIVYKKSVQDKECKIKLKNIDEAIDHCHTLLMKGYHIVFVVRSHPYEHGTTVTKDFIRREEIFSELELIGKSIKTNPLKKIFYKTFF